MVQMLSSKLASMRSAETTKKNTFEGGDIVGAVGKSIDEYKELNEEDKTKTKVAMIVLVLVGLLFLSAM
jgi:hypothetical protein